jgi:hypothetical protein
MTQSHHDVTSLDIVMFFSLEISTLTRADVAVLVIFLAGIRMFLSRLTIMNIALFVQNHCVVPRPFVGLLFMI